MKLKTHTLIISLILLGPLALNAKPKSPDMRIDFIITNTMPDQPGQFLLGHSHATYSMDVTKTYETDPAIDANHCKVSQKPTISIESIAKSITLHYAFTLNSDGTAITGTQSIAFGEQVRNQEIFENLRLSLYSIILQNDVQSTTNNQ
jgi:hypothetical protein